MLESQLAEEDGTWEVINTGVSGWGTDQEYLFLVSEGFKYTPDIVVLAFFLINDPFNNVAHRQYGLNNPVFLNADLELANVPVPTPDKPPADIPVNTDPRYLLEISVAIIDRMSDACAAHGCELVVMAFGKFIASPSRDMQAWNAILQRQVTQQVGARFLDLDKAFSQRSISKQELVEGNHELHWNAYGHRQVGNILHQYLKETGLLNPARPLVGDDPS